MEYEDFNRYTAVLLGEKLASNDTSTQKRQSMDMNMTIQVFSDHIKVSSGLRKLTLRDNGSVSHSIGEVEYESDISGVRKAVNGDIEVLQRKNWRDYIKESTKDWSKFSKADKKLKLQGPPNPLISKLMLSQKCKTALKKVIVDKCWVLVYAGTLVSLVNIESKDFTIKAGTYPIIFQDDCKEDITIYPRRSAIKRSGIIDQVINIIPRSEAAIIVSKTSEIIPLENTTSTIGKRKIVVRAKSNGSVSGSTGPTKIDSSLAKKDSSLPSPESNSKDALIDTGSKTFDDLMRKLDAEKHKHHIPRMLKCDELEHKDIYSFLHSNFKRFEFALLISKRNLLEDSEVISLRESLVSADSKSTEVLFNFKYLLDRIFLLKIALLTFLGNIDEAKELRLKSTKSTKQSYHDLLSFIELNEDYAESMLNIINDHEANLGTTMEKLNDDDLVSIKL